MTSAASTANAAVPAPGKLEFKDDYTPEEAERVIRNSKGLPVGVKPVRGCGIVLLRDRLPFLRVLYSDQDHAYRRCERDAGRARA